MWWPCRAGVLSESWEKYMNLQHHSLQKSNHSSSSLLIKIQDSNGAATPGIAPAGEEDLFPQHGEADWEGLQEMGRVRKKVKSSIRQLQGVPGRAWARIAACWISTALGINRITFLLLFQPPQNTQVEEHKPREILVKAPLKNECLLVQCCEHSSRESWHRWT